jgi:very-short-patch-repair endonuclease
MFTLLSRRISRTERILEKELRKTGVVFIPQARLCGYRPDFYLPEWNVAVEVDGPWHMTEEGSKRDSVRDNRLNREGIYVVRISWEQVRTNAKAAADFVINQARSHSMIWS